MNCLPFRSSVLTLGAGGCTSATGMKARSWASRRQLGSPRVTWLALISLLSGLLASSQAKVFSRCELAKELNRLGLNGFRGYELADWVCLAYFTSGFNTAAVDHEADGSTNNGLFQINSRKWCRNLAPDSSNLCRMYCSDLLIPDLKNTIVCVMKIVSGPKGLGYWEAWRHHCQGKDLRDWVDGCEL